MRQADGSSDRRWVVLLEDGRHSTLGRASDPDEHEIARAEEHLVLQGLAGWLAIQSHSEFAEGSPPEVMEVRPLGKPTGAFIDAVAAFQRRIAT